MTENIAYLSDFKEFDGGYVTFRGGAHGGRISGKGTLKTDSLNFEEIQLHRCACARFQLTPKMYLTASRPDIMFAVCACARFQLTPKTSYLLAIKRIFRYLKDKLTLGIWYSRDSLFELVAYTNSDYAGATQDRKSTTGGCQFLGNRLISWQCKKQNQLLLLVVVDKYSGFKIN
ncbi:hypothetical protein Tco_0080844, partial [Tanacetum coccineum]